MSCAALATFRREARRKWRLMIAKASNLTGMNDSGFYIPYRYANPQASPYYRAAEVQLANSTEQFAEVLKWIDEYRWDLLSFSGPPPRPRFNQDWFTGLDAAAAYAIVRRVRPQRIFEIGSGHSTRFMAQAVIDGVFRCMHRCIDPAPRASLARMSVDWDKALFSGQYLVEVSKLEAGDIFFVDSSHIAMPGTDVDLIFSDVLPNLREGVLLHIHDVFLPDPYPKCWGWRGYNEQSLVASVIAMKSIRPLFASHYARTRLKTLLEGSVIGQLPAYDVSVPESSLWATINA